ncbi:hypothetical protein NQ314_000372 [Rhamnusium bicolor]|uniref:Uncharacterized protein n=1 Tax=Rhamnusium bicolor TaxID=1586634 RepID=A0AAV8ZV22_9CUCU|nr:hypothetical protein NQ314_000372 [Rhamnusium bicolor]
MFFSINEPGRDPGFGQSILHEGMLIFRTPPYIVTDITLQDTLTRSKPTRKLCESPKVMPLEREKSLEKVPYSSPNGITDRKVSRRFSSTSIK